MQRPVLLLFLEIYAVSVPAGGPAAAVDAASAGVGPPGVVGGGCAVDACTSYVAVAAPCVAFVGYVSLPVLLIQAAATAAVCNFKDSAITTWRRRRPHV